MKKKDRLTNITRLVSSMVEEVELAKNAERETRLELGIVLRDLLSEVLDMEPMPTRSGKNPIIEFTKTFGDDKEYTYVATAVTLADGTQRWFTTGREARRYEWSSLVRLMGASGLSTLEVVRGRVQ